MSFAIAAAGLPVWEPDVEAEEFPAVVRRILFTSDLSPQSDAAFDHARLLAEKFAARLSLCHVVEAPPPRDPVSAEIVRRATESARLHLEGLALNAPPRRHVMVYREESAREALVRHVAATRPDLTVLATHGRHGLAHLMLGSVAETLLARSRRPVLCVRQPDHGVALRYRRVLVPTDLSEHSRRAFGLAALLARAFQAEVVAVHVARLPALGGLDRVPEVVERAVPDEAEVAAFVKPKLEGAPLVVRIPWGSAERAILDTASSEKADVIVMSTRGHDSLADSIGGSLTERVVRQAPCPVLAL